jgi:glutaredoxin-like protein NrdH
MGYWIYLNPFNKYKAKVDISVPIYTFILERLLKEELEMQQKIKLTVYVSKKCGFCHKLTSWLKEQGISYFEKEITEDENNRHEYIKHGFRAVPLTIIEKNGIINKLVGFNIEQLNKELKE